MAEIKNGTPVSSPITPGRDDANTWPTHLAKYGGGGLEVVNTIDERNAITDERKIDKVVLVRNDADGEQGLYEWSNSSWNKVDLDKFIGMTVDDGTNNFGAIAELKLVGLKASQDPNDSIDSVTITAEDNAIDWATMGDPTTGVKAKSVLAEPPLQVFADPDKSDTARLKLQEGVFEPRHAPGYLAYVAYPEEVIGKQGYHALGHYDSAIYPTDVVVDGGSFIVTDVAHKVIGIQEYDNKDPNATGGADFLVAARLAFKGNAVNTGKIKVYLAKQPPLSGGNPEYLKDTNGDILVKEVGYKAGDKYGSIEVMGIVNAKGLVEFSLHVEHTFDNNLLIEERATGLSGIMVQALEGFSKTGPALVQYEVDTQQNIEFNKVYYGDSLMTFNWEVTHGLPMSQIQVGVGANLPDGFHFKNLSNIHIGSEDGHIYIRDAGEVCDFSFGKIFNAFDTRALRGKEITAKATLNAKGSPFTVALVKWTGKPDIHTNSIFSQRNNATIVFDTGWELVDSLFFAESPTDNFETSSKKFIVPSDANNFAVVVYPGIPNTPLELKIKDFDVDVNNPFYAYELYESGKINELHWHEDTKYARFTQDNENYASLRYTIGKSVEGSPMPCGVFRKGKADITLDPTLNQIVGSAATSGEGGLKFGKEGKAIVDTTLWLHSEQPAGTTSNVKFWYELVNSNNVATKIIPSETSFEISGNSSGDYSMKEFTIDVVVGDRLILKASADVDDGAFLQSNSPAHPLVDIEIRIDELVSGYNDNPFDSVDLSQFDVVYSGTLVATKIVQNKTSADFNIDIPEDMNLSVLSAIKQLTDGSIRPVRSLDWVYSNATKTLTVSFGETVEIGAVTLGIYTL